VLLSEELAKQDTAFESSANKLVDVIRSLLGSEAATKLAGSLSVNESKEEKKNKKNKKQDFFLLCVSWPIEPPAWNPSPLVLNFSPVCLLFFYCSLELETIDNYLKTFQWNTMKYRTDKSLVELAEILNTVRKKSTTKEEQDNRSSFTSPSRRRGFSFPPPHPPSLPFSGNSRSTRSLPLPDAFD